MKNIKLLAMIACFVLLTGCAALTVRSKTIIDYRYTAQYTEYETDSNNKITTTNNPEKFELLWEITYEDGSTRRVWEECTRFEYQNAKEELGVVEP